MGIDKKLAMSEEDTNLVFGEPIKLKKVTEEDVKKMKLVQLIETSGINKEYCVWVASRYCENFENRVKYYKILPLGRVINRTRVIFYADNIENSK